MIPPAVSPSCKSGAERRFFEILQSVESEPGARVFHSLALPQHERKREGEIDFLVLTSKALLVLEVKGGGVACHGGRWSYTNRFGVANDGGSGPFDQARTAMYSLIARIRSDLGDAVTRELTYGFGVVLPDCVFDVVSEEWEPETVIDRRDMNRAGVGRYLDDLVEHWASKGRRRGGPTRSQMDQIATFVRPDFDRVPVLGAWGDELHARTVQLTEAQFSSLELIEEMPRLLFSGGAGTGKTFLAAEVARRHARQGKKTLLSCHSPTLAAFLRGSVAEENVDVMSFDRALEAAVAPYEVVVLDEGQDLLSIDSLLSLDGLVEGGLAGGVWRVFLDHNNQSGLTGAFDPEALAELSGYASHTPTLGSNLRNTRQVISHTRLLTGADLGTPSLGDGPTVETLETDEASADAERLTEWLARIDRVHGVSPGEVTILSRLPFDESAARFLPRRILDRLVVVTPETVSRWPRDGLTFATVTNFKGLENRFIALVDVDAELMATAARNMLYVALSRARVGLWVAVRTAAMPAVRLLVDRNLPLLEENVR